eukprot:7232898-Prymnesium_polylepis.1
MLRLVPHEPRRVLRPAAREPHRRSAREVEVARARARCVGGRERVAQAQPASAEQFDRPAPHQLLAPQIRMGQPRWHAQVHQLGRRVNVDCRARLPRRC